MHNTNLRPRLALLVLATAALLGACGGGSDPAPLPTMPTETVPDSATASVRAYTEFTGSLVARVHGSESAQPLLLNAADAPTSEQEAPLPVL